MRSFYTLYPLTILLALLTCSLNAAGDEITAKDRYRLAQQVETLLQRENTEVAIIARVGRPLEELPAGIHYTHTAFVLRTAAGYEAYNLYQQEEQPELSKLEKGSLEEFFSEVHHLKAGITIPEAAFQHQLKRGIQSPLFEQLHNSRYSVIANPFDHTYQNCTEHMLDLIFAIHYSLEQAPEIKRQQQKSFTPQLIHLPWWELWLGSLLEADVALSDHQHQVATTTYTTIANFLHGLGLVQKQLTVTP